MKRLALLLILPLAILSRSFAIEIQPQAALARVRRIFVDQLGGGKTSDQMRDMMIAALQAS